MTLHMAFSRRKQQQLDSDWTKWPVEAQVQLLESLKALDAPYEGFKQRYFNDPVQFARDCIDWQGGGLASYQESVLASLPIDPSTGMNWKRLAVRGPHTLGKTCMASVAILWFALTRDGLDWKVPTTASVARQLSEFLWPEIHKWVKRLKWDVIGRPEFTRDELMTETLKLRTGKAFAMTATDETGTEGAHADHLFYLFDEAKAIESSRWDAAEGALMGGEGKEIIALAISTPGDPQGRFYDIHKRKPGYEDWTVRHVTIDECIQAGRATRQFVEQRKRQWGESSAVFQNRVLGEFCESSEDTVIPLSWIELANQRWLDRIEILDPHWNWIDGAKRGAWPRWSWRSQSDADPLTHLGIDIARSDLGDKTVIARRQVDTITQLDRYALADTQPIVGYATRLLEKWGCKATVDIIGIGSGPYDQLRELFKSRVRPFNASESSDLKDRSKELEFSNKRSAAWWHLRELLDPAYGPTLALPPCDILTGDLTAPRRGRDTASGKITVESKRDIRKRLGRSTDDGDAVVMAFYPEKELAVSVPAYSVSYVSY